MKNKKEVIMKHEFTCQSCKRKEIVETETQTLAITTVRFKGWGINKALDIILCPICWDIHG